MTLLYPPRIWTLDEGEAITINPPSAIMTGYKTASLRVAIVEYLTRIPVKYLDYPPRTKTAAVNVKLDQRIELRAFYVNREGKVISGVSNTLVWGSIPN